jgi:hypothetical protein
LKSKSHFWYFRQSAFTLWLLGAGRSESETAVSQDFFDDRSVGHGYPSFEVMHEKLCFEANDYRL